MKLYIIVDGSLSPGQQVAQATHAAFALAVNFPALIAPWYRKSNYLVVLSSSQLAAEAERLGAYRDLIVMRIHEPDLPGNPLVAVAIAPDPAVGPLVSSLPLALKMPAMAT